ncbi:MAG: hypothetical protein HY059_10150 [Proteobacteria bacterium]|nr:hypothetical protein [Pseudomonadota bacterium]
MNLRSHLYEFHAVKKKLKCTCGWERTLKSSDVDKAYARFSDHMADMALTGKHVY